MIRIQKARKNDKANKSVSGFVSVLTSDEQLLWRENKELISSPNKEALEQRYVMNVIIPLLGPKHVDAGVSKIPISYGSDGFFVEADDLESICGLRLAFPFFFFVLFFRRFVFLCPRSFFSLLIRK